MFQRDAEERLARKRRNQCVTPDAAGMERISMSDDDLTLIQSVRLGDPAAWEQLIARYEGRLLAFAQSRLRDTSAAEDIVQEAFLGFLISLPNYDPSTTLESFLFAITAHKLTDVLRRTGRRPALLPLTTGTPEGSEIQLAGRDRRASSLARSQEQTIAEQTVLRDCLKGLIQSWLSRGEFERLECIELLFVLGWSNKEAAAVLGISEQSVANHKSFVIGKLKAAADAANLRHVNWSTLVLDKRT